jgi:cyclopropane-fatty-acyl-phospholipid synthase
MSVDTAQVKPADRPKWPIPIQEILRDYFRSGGPPPHLPQWCRDASPYRHPSRPRASHVLMRGLDAVCEVAARVMGKPTLSPRDNTARCYQHLFDPLVGATGAWPDYTEGLYLRGDEDYDAARAKQAEAVLRLCGLHKAMRVLDVGCGNGGFLEQVERAGGKGSGITLSPPQVDTCRSKGLDVHLCDFDDVQRIFEPGAFDIVTFSGPMEHLVTEEDARAGRQDSITEAALAKVAWLLKPGGRFFVASIHFREPVDISQMSANPLDHEIESHLFFCSNLARIFSGWYPHGDQIPRAAARAGLRQVCEQDATWDYLLTSMHWGKRTTEVLLRDKRFTLRFIAELFSHDPRYFFQALLMYYYGTWTWQFRGGEHSPMVHTWRLFERS